MKKRNNRVKSRLQSETSLSNDSSKYGNITDRFIPIMHSSKEARIYHSEPSRRQRKPTYESERQLRRSSNSLSGILNDSNTENPVILRSGGFLINSYVGPLSIEREQLRESNTDCRDLAEPNENSFHEISVAKALGFKIKSRILNFKPLKSHKKPQSVLGDSEEKETRKAVDDVKDKNEKKIKKSVSLANVRKEVPFKVLDAPGLRNDYYSNVVCWAKKSDKIAVGLNVVVYTWSETTGTVPLQSLDNELISALAFSDDDILAVGTKGGKVFIYGPQSYYIIAVVTLKNNVGICSIKWIPGTTKFFIGDDTGNMSLYEAIEYIDPDSNNIEYKLVACSTFKCDQQQICGIDINPTNHQIAVGANNNCVSVWDISNLDEPKKIFHLPHDAAVKAVAFCPWMPNLLVTGGGSRDRNIRFWHTASGTLISKYETRGQITSIVWSRYKKELLVTFGFGNSGERNIILSVYSYPTLKLKTMIDAPSDMRILTSDISNDFKSICAAVSDQSIRIYTIWNSKYDLKTGNYDTGIYGSEIIELEEGIDTSFETIR